MEPQSSCKTSITTKATKESIMGIKSSHHFVLSYTEAVSILRFLFFTDFLWQLLYGFPPFSRNSLKSRSSLFKASHSIFGIITTSKSSATDTFDSYFIFHHTELSNEHSVHFYSVSMTKVIEGFIQNRKKEWGKRSRFNPTNLPNFSF